MTSHPDTTAHAPASLTLSQRLKAETASQHDRMESLMARANPFGSREAYARFTASQYLFQQDVEHFFDDAGLRAAVPDLHVRGRLQAARDDLVDLGQATPHAPAATAGITMPQALGWLYVSEGSTLGAAFLFKEAQDKLGLSATFGARNLAAYPGGRAKVWKQFVATLDAQPAATHDAVIAGAHAAYDRMGQLLAALPVAQPAG